MITIGETVYLSMEKESEDTITMDSGLEIALNTTYDAYRHARQYGIVEGLNKNISKKHGLMLGDKIYFHHFVAGTNAYEEHLYDSNATTLSDKKIYRAEIPQIYAYVRDGEITMINNWLFLEPLTQEIEETKSGILLSSAPKEVEREGILKNLNSEAIRLGMSIGDRVLFSLDSEYEMTIEGDKLYRMRNEDVLAILPS